MMEHRLLKRERHHYSCQNLIMGRKESFWGIYKNKCAAETYAFAAQPLAGYLKFDFALRLCIVLNAEEHLTIGGLSDDALAVKGLVIIIQPYLGDD